LNINIGYDRFKYYVFFVGYFHKTKSSHVTLIPMKDIQSVKIKVKALMGERWEGTDDKALMMIRICLSNVVL